MHGTGRADGLLSEEKVARILDELLADEDPDGKRVLVIIPDGTRTAPSPLMFRLLHEALSGRVASLDFLVALGTHRAMSEDQINRLVGAE